MPTKLPFVLSIARHVLCI